MTENLKELIDKIKVLQEEEGDMKKIEELVKKVVAEKYKSDYVKYEGDMYYEP